MASQLKLWELKTCLLRSPCPSCGNSHGHIFRSENGVHSGLIRCSECDRFLKWVSKPEFDRALKSELVN